jgi:hypothetical protein
MTKLKLYAVTIYNKTIKVIANDIQSASDCYPDADSIIESGEYSFIGSGVSGSQTVTKIVAPDAVFKLTTGSSSGVSHSSTPTDADITVAAPATIACSYYPLAPTQEITGYEWNFGDSNVASSSNTSNDSAPTKKYETAGTYIITLKAAGINGQSAGTNAIGYAKVTIT